MKAVEYDVEQLKRVLLLLVGELFLEAGHYVFEVVGNYHWLVADPQVLDQLGVGDTYEALGAERVLSIDLIDEATLKEVVSKCLAVAEALDRAVHVTRVREVQQACQTSSNPAERLCPVETLPVVEAVNLLSTVHEVELVIFLLALL